MKWIAKAALAVGLAFSGAASQAATNTYYGNAQQATFQSLMDTSFTLLDVSAYGTGTTTTTLSTLFSDMDFFTSPVSNVRNDDLIPNGQGIFGATNPHVGMNFAAGVNGVGVYANTFDGGRILAYDGLNGTGNLLGEAAYGNASGNAAFNFGAFTSDTLIMSVVFTCEFNGDLACGIIDPQWGTGASFAAAVPVPAGGALLVTAIAGLGIARRRKASA